MLPRLVAAPHVSRVNPHAQGFIAKMFGRQFGLQRATACQHRFPLFGSAVDWQEHDLERGDAGWQHKAVVVGVRHDHGADKPGRHAPRRRPTILLLAAGTREFDLLSLCEILAKKMRCACLECLAVLHHGLDGVGVDGTRKPFARRLWPLHNGHCQIAFGKSCVDVEHPERFLNRLLPSGVRRVPLLPEEFGGPQKHSRPHLPSHDVGPLVDQYGQVSPRLNPLGVHRPDDRLARGPHDEWFFEFPSWHEFAIGPEFQSVVCDDGAFFRKPFHMLRLLFQVRQRNKEWKVRILVTGCLEHSIQNALHAFPDCVAVWLDHHAATHG